MSRRPHHRFDCAEGCPVEAALAVIGGKWKGTILFHLLRDEVLRFNEIRRLLPGQTRYGCALYRSAARVLRCYCNCAR